MIPETSNPEKFVVPAEAQFRYFYAPRALRSFGYADRSKSRWRLCTG